jgi:integrase
MARPLSTELTITECPGRALPWRARWRESTRAGERLRRSKYFATQGEAEAFKATIEQAAAAIPERPPTLGIPVTPPAPAIGEVLAHAPRGSLTFRVFAQQWLDEVVARRKPSTVRSYRGILAMHINPTLGAVRVSSTTLGPEQIVGVIAARTAAGVGWGTQKAILRVLSTCLRWAVKYGHLQKNPVLGLTKDLKDDSDPDYRDPEPNPLSAEDAAAFLEWLQTGRVPGGAADRPVDGPKLRGGSLRSEGYPEWHPYFFTLLRTGMRRGEAAALKWSTVYLEGARGPKARLESSYSPSARAAAETFSSGDGTLKSKRPREIDLAGELADVLRELARTRRAEALKERRLLSPYVFVTPRGARILSDSATAERIFERGMIAIGRDHAGHTIHDLRDTFATLHLQQDPGRLFWVSMMLGHRQTSTTLNRYTKWVPALSGANFASALDRPRLGGASRSPSDRQD